MVFPPPHIVRKNPNNKRTQKTYSRVSSPSCSSLPSSLLCPTSTLACSSIQTPAPSPEPPPPPSILAQDVWGLGHRQLQRDKCCIHWNVTPCVSLLVSIFLHIRTRQAAQKPSIQTLSLGKEKSAVTTSPFKSKAKRGSSRQCHWAWLLPPALVTPRLKMMLWQ